MKTSLPNASGMGNLIHSGVNSNMVTVDERENNSENDDPENRMVFQEVYEEGVEYEESF